MPLFSPPSPLALLAPLVSQAATIGQQLLASNTELEGDVASWREAIVLLEAELSSTAERLATAESGARHQAQRALRMKARVSEAERDAEAQQTLDSEQQRTLAALLRDRGKLEAQLETQARRLATEYDHSTSLQQQVDGLEGKLRRARRGVAREGGRGGRSGRRGSGGSGDNGGSGDSGHVESPHLGALLSPQNALDELNTEESSLSASLGFAQQPRQRDGGLRGPRTLANARMQLRDASVEVERLTVALAREEANRAATCEALVASNEELRAANGVLAERVRLMDKEAAAIRIPPSPNTAEDLSMQLKRADAQLFDHSSVGVAVLTPDNPARRRTHTSAPLAQAVPQTGEARVLTDTSAGGGGGGGSGGRGGSNDRDLMRGPWDGGKLYSEASTQTMAVAQSAMVDGVARVAAEEEEERDCWEREGGAVHSPQHIYEGAPGYNSMMPVELPSDLTDDDSIRSWQSSVMDSDSDASEAGEVAAAADGVGGVDAVNAINNEASANLSPHKQGNEAGPRLGLGPEAVTRFVERNNCATPVRSGDRRAPQKRGRTPGETYYVSPQQVDAALNSGPSLHRAELDSSEEEGNGLAKVGVGSANFSRILAEGIFSPGSFVREREFHRRRGVDIGTPRDGAQDGFAVAREDGEMGGGVGGGAGDGAGEGGGNGTGEDGMGQVKPFWHTFGRWVMGEPVATNTARRRLWDEARGDDSGTKPS
jgi:hypothetical protein